MSFSTFWHAINGLGMYVLSHFRII